MKRAKILAHCRTCEASGMAYADEVQIIHQPDGNSYLWWPCPTCGEWRTKALAIETTLMFANAGVPCFDWAEGVADTPPPAPSIATIAHMLELGNLPSDAVQAIMVAAAEQCLPADDEAEQ